MNFSSYKKCHNPAGQTLTRWVKQLYKQAGVKQGRVAVMLVTAVVLTGCAQFQPVNRSDTSPKVPLNPPKNNSANNKTGQITGIGALPGPGKTDHTGAIRHDVESPRIAQLWAASEKAILANNLEQAERYIQDALKITPEDSVLWSRAAELKLTLLEPELAENYAGKSIAYAGDNGTLLHRNWLIIEHARDLRGDLLGVRDAHKMVQRFQY